MLKVLQVRIQEQGSCKFRNSKYVSLDQLRSQTMFLQNFKALWFILFICLYFHTCIYVLFLAFQDRRVHFNQDLLPFLATSELEVLDWDLWCIWAFYCNRAWYRFESVDWMIWLRWNYRRWWKACKERSAVKEETGDDRPNPLRWQS